MLSTHERDLLRGLAQLAMFAAVVWFTLPTRPNLTPYAWRAAARGAQALSDHASELALWCRSRYWKAVRL